MRVLVVGRDESFRNLVRLILENSFAAEVAECVQEAEAVPIIAEGIDCILYDYEPGTSPEPEVTRLLSAGVKTPLILCAPDSETESDTENDALKNAQLFGRFSKDFVIEPMQTLFTRLASQISPEKKSNDPEFYRVRVSVLRDLGLLKCDAYIRLADDKFVKAAREGDTFDEADFERYQRKNVDYLYIQRNEFSLFLKQLAAGMSGFSRNRREADGGAGELRAAAGTVELIHSATAQFGFSKELEEVTRASVDLAINTFRKIPELDNLILALESVENYFSSHSMMLAYISCGFANAMGWNSDLTRYKLTLAAFLHDVTIKDSELARFQNVFDVTMANQKYTQAELLDYQDHPTKSSLLVHQFEQIPAEVDVIIAQHHERADGSGFPNRLQYSEIHPLSCCFIMAHDLVSYITVKGKDWNIGDYLNEAADRFRVGTFKELMRSITISAARSKMGH